MKTINVKIGNGNTNKKLAVIGALPGYNTNIDTSDHILEKDLLHNISFIDLILTTYSVASDSSNIFSFVSSMLKNAISSTKLYNYNLVNEDDKIYKNFKTLINKYVTSDNDIYGARIIASSDSLSTETISNNFGDSMLYNMINNSSLVKGVSSLSSYTNMIKELSYEQVWSLFDNLQSITNQNSSTLAGKKNIISTLFSSAALGVRIALPKFYESSSYSQNISVFFKLTAPCGNSMIIDKLIFQPLKLILLMAAPNSLNGLSYAFPFLYRVIAHGNAYASVGYISDITISKGSMETIYSDEFLPLSIDVRLNIRTISENFANIIPGTINDDFNNVGLTSPALTSGIDINESGVAPNIDKVITFKL